MIEREIVTKRLIDIIWRVDTDLRTAVYLARLTATCDVSSLVFDERGVKEGYGELLVEYDPEKRSRPDISKDIPVSSIHGDDGQLNLLRDHLRLQGYTGGALWADFDRQSSGRLVFHPKPRMIGRIFHEILEDRQAA
jgi:hypothetical protein